MSETTKKVEAKKEAPAKTNKREIISKKKMLEAGTYFGHRTSQ